MMDISLIMLASGLSSRFGEENKLMSDFRGKPLCAHTAGLGCELPRAKRIVIVPEDNLALAKLYETENWTVLKNSNPHLGQSHSLKMGIELSRDLGVDATLVCLADMPLIDQAHLSRIRDACLLYDAVMSRVGETLLPPAAFRRSMFEDILNLDGDAGAKRVFLSTQNRQTVELSHAQATDVDTPEDLAALSSRDTCHA